MFGLFNRPHKIEEVKYVKLDNNTAIVHGKNSEGQEIAMRIAIKLIDELKDREKNFRKWIEVPVVDM